MQLVLLIPNYSTHGRRALNVSISPINSILILYNYASAAIYKKWFKEASFTNIIFTTLASMDQNLFLFLLLATLFAQPLVLLAQPPIPTSHITVQGSVFCDACHDAAFSRHSYFLPGNFLLVTTELKMLHFWTLPMWKLMMLILTLCLYLMCIFNRRASPYSVQT